MASCALFYARAGICGHSHKPPPSLFGIRTFTSHTLLWLSWADYVLADVADALVRFLCLRSLPSLSIFALYLRSLSSLSIFALCLRSLPLLSVFALYLCSLFSLSIFALYLRSLFSLSTFAPYLRLLSTSTRSPPSLFRHDVKF